MQLNSADGIIYSYGFNLALVEPRIILLFLNPAIPLSGDKGRKSVFGGVMVF
jgi:hypothetical protein